MKEVVIGKSGVSLCRAELAINPWSRGLGLLFRNRLPEDHGLWIRPCRWIHSFFMRFPIDVVFLAVDGTVIKTEPDLKAFRFSAGGPRSHSVVELSAGFIAHHQLAVGDQLDIATADNVTGTGESSIIRIPRFGRRQNRQVSIGETLTGFARLVFDALSFPVIAFFLGVGLGLVGLAHPPIHLSRLISNKTRQHLPGLSPVRLFHPSIHLGRLIAEETKQRWQRLGHCLRRISRADTAVSTGLGSIYELVTDLSDRQSPPAAQTATVLLVTGPEFNQSFQLGDRPEIIGATHSSRVHLPAAPGVAGEHARFWWRDQQLMLHHLATDQVTRVNGNPVTWASLEEGDEVWIGPYQVRISRISQNESLPGPRDRLAVENETLKLTPSSANVAPERF